MKRNVRTSGLVFALICWKKFFLIKKNENNVDNNSIEKSIYANTAYPPWEQSLHYTGNRACVSQIKPHQPYQSLLPLCTYELNRPRQSPTLALPGEKIAAGGGRTGPLSVSAPAGASGKRPGRVTQTNSLNSRSQPAWFCLKQIRQHAHRRLHWDTCGMVGSSRGHTLTSSSGPAESGGGHQSKITSSFVF